MKYFILVHNNNTHKINWENFKDKDRKLFLITDSKSKEKLQSSGKLNCLDECHVLSDDFRDFTTANLKKVVDDIIQRNAITLSDLCIATISEKDSSACAELRELYNIEGDRPSDIEPFRNKIVMKDRLSATPKTKKYLPKYLHFKYDDYQKNKESYIKSITDHIDPPFFAKPLAESSSRGVALLQTKQELVEFLSSLTCDYDIEEYVTGTLYHCDTVIVNGKIECSFVSEYLNSHATVTAERPSGSMIVDESEPFYPSVKEFNESVLNTLLKPGSNAVTHLEFFRKENGEIRFVEIAKRPAGPLIPEVYEKMYNFNLYEVGWCVQMGIKPVIDLKRVAYAGHCFIPRLKGKIKTLHDVTHFSGQHQTNWFVKEGDVQKMGMDGAYSRIGEVVFWNEDYRALKNDFNSLRTHQFSTVEDLFTYVVIRQGTVLENWQAISDEVMANFIMICNDKIYKELQQKDYLKYFKRVVVTDNFSYDNLAKIVRDNRFDQYSGKMRFITPNEDFVLNVGKLNTLYADENCQFTEKNVLAYINKAEMKQYLGEEIRCPKFIEIVKNKETAETLLSKMEKFYYPVIVKPVSGSDSRNVEKLNSQSELLSWFSRAPLDDVYEIDEFISGELYHCDSIVHNGECVVTFVSRYTNPCAEFLTGKTNGSIPLQMNSEEYLKLASFANKVLTKLPNLGNVVTHMEVFVSNGECCFLEIAARPGGGLIVDTYQKTFGINITDTNFRIQLGAKLPSYQTHPSQFSAWINYPKRYGQVQSLKNKQILSGKSDYETIFTADLKHELHDAKVLSDVAAKIKLSNADYNKLLTDFNYLRNRLIYDTSHVFTLNAKDQYEFAQLEKSLVRLNFLGMPLSYRVNHNALELIVSINEKVNVTLVGLIRNILLSQTKFVHNDHTSYRPNDLTKVMTENNDWHKHYHPSEKLKIEKYINAFKEYLSNEINDPSLPIMRRQANMYRRFSPKTEGKSVIKFNTGAATFKPFYDNSFSSFFAAISKDMSEKEVPRYASCLPDKELTSAANKFLHEHNLIPANLNLTEDQIVLGNGTVQTFYMAMAVMLKPGDMVLMTRPNYGIFMPELKDFGCEIGFVDTEGDFKLTPDKLQQAVEDYNNQIANKYLISQLLPWLIKIENFLGEPLNSGNFPSLPLDFSHKRLEAYVVELNRYISSLDKQKNFPIEMYLPEPPRVRAFFHVNPHNPTGAVYSQKEIDGLANTLNQYPEMVVIDDIVHYGILHKLDACGTFANSPNFRSPLISLFSGSKNFCQANMRAGIAYGSKSLILKMQDKLSDMTTSISLPSYRSLIYLFNSKHKDRLNYLEQNNLEYKSRKQLLSLLISGIDNCKEKLEIKLLQAKRIQLWLKEKSISNPSEIMSLMLTGVPYFRCEVDPGGSFFFLINTQKLIGLRIGSLVLESTIDVRNALCQFANIDVLPGELSANDDKHTLRVNFTRTPEEMIEASFRLHAFIYMLRNDQGRLPKFLIEKLHDANQLTKHPIVARISKMRGSPDQISKSISFLNKDIEQPQMKLLTEEQAYQRLANLEQRISSNNKI